MGTHEKGMIVKMYRPGNNNKFEKSQLKFYIYLVPIAVVMGCPIIYLFCHAFKPISELFAFPPRFFVYNPTLDNFRNLFSASQTSSIPMSRYLFNSLVVTLGIMLGSVVLSTMAGFAFSKLRFKGKNALFEVNTIALMFVGTAVAIPTYLVMNSLNILDSYLAYLLPAFAMPVGLFLVKQFIDEVPNELIEAAVVDGAGNLTIFRKIIIPMVTPAIATIAILSFQQVWNDAAAATTYIDTESLRTLAFYMGTLSNVGTVAGQGIAAAAGLIMFIPNLVLFIFMQGKVMNTMAHSGLK